MTVEPCDPMHPTPFRVGRTIRETADTATFEILPEGNGRRVPFTPGQFNMLYLFGLGEVPISISGDPGRSDRWVHTVRSVGAVTRGFLGLRRGDRLGVRGPFGRGWPLERAVGHDVVVVAGGIGLAPLRPVLYEIAARRERYGRVVLLYGTRTPEDVLFQSTLADMAAHEIDVQITVDRSSPDWRGRVGVVTHLIPYASFEPRNTVAMICGPEIMARFTVLELERRGLLHDHIFISMERNMKCGIGHCGHCQYGAQFVCKEGPVFAYEDIRALFNRSEV